VFEFGERRGSDCLCIDGACLPWCRVGNADPGDGRRPQGGKLALLVGAIYIAARRGYLQLEMRGLWIAAGFVIRCVAIPSRRLELRL